MNWPYKISSSTPSSVYAFNQSTNLAKDLIRMQRNLILLGKYHHVYLYPNIYHINTTSESEAIAIYASLMPQLSVKVNRHTKTNLDVDLGFHRYDYAGNVVTYGEIDYMEKDMDLWRKKHGDLITTISYYPWVTILNTMMLHNNTPSTLYSYSK